MGLILDFNSEEYLRGVSGLVLGLHTRGFCSGPVCVASAIASAALAVVIAAWSVSQSREGKGCIPGV